MRQIALFTLVCLCAAAGFMAVARLPADRSALIQEKYETWSGVLRVWVAEETSPFRPIGWLNRCAGEAEKDLDGIYINIRSVPADAIAGLRSNGINPPDVIIYPRGLIGDTCRLQPIAGIYPLRRGLGHDPYALPIILDTRFWISHGPLPGDLSGTAIALRPDDACALVGLCSGPRPSEAVEAPLPGLDLGLDGPPAATAAPGGRISCGVSPETVISEDPSALFISGDISAFPGGIADLRELEDNGAVVSVTGTCAIVSDALMCSVCTDDEARAGAVDAFIAALMGGGQARTAEALGFPAISGTAAWADDLFLGPAEAALESLLWIYPASDGDAAAADYIEGTLSADEALMQIRSGT